VPFDNYIGETAAYIRRIYGLPLPDAGIIATAVRYDVPLVTRDIDLRKVMECALKSIDAM